MKKLSFLLMAMLISLVSFAEEATLSFADKANRTSFSATQQVWEQNGVKLTNDKAGYANNLGDYANPVRLYAKTTITIECSKGNMTQILFVAGSNDYAKALNTSLGTAFGTVTVSGSNVTLTPSTPAASVGAITMSAQVRLKSITVTYEKAESTEPTITCANASFGVVKAGSETTKELVVEAENLTEAITTSFETGTAFSVTGDLTTTGGTLTLAVIATEEGTYNDVLTLTSGTATKTVEISATVIVCDGEGTQEKPYSVADVKKLGNSEEIAWVEGYIVGTMHNNKLATDTVINSNFVLATTTEDTVTLVPVALPSGDVRTALNLVDNPDNLGKKVAVKGKLEAYFSMPGVKSVSEYEWIVETPAGPEYETMDITMTNLEVMEMGDILVLTASDDDNTGLNVMLAVDADGSLTSESYISLAQGWMETELPIVEGTITKTYSEELATDVYSGLVVVEYMEGKLGLNLTMYSVPVEVIDVVIEDATITVEELPDGLGGTYELVNISAQWGESTLLLEGLEKKFEGFIQITETFLVDGVEDWYIWMCMNGTVTTVDNVITVTGEFKNNFTGSIYNVTISGALPVVEPTTITWELNGGEFPTVEVPTNAELWEIFKPYYNEYYNLARADQPIDKVSTFAAAKMQEIMTDAASEYKWLGDYVLNIAAGQGVNLPTDMAAANEGAWRWAVHAFFNATTGANGAAGTDFTEAGKPENWGPAYQAAKGAVVLPTEPVEADYTLPTPTKTGYEFVGWYDNAEGAGEAMTVLPAGWAGTIYAIWKESATTSVENNIIVEQAVKVVLNGQVLIVIGDKTFNVMGQQVK